MGLGPLLGESSTEAVVFGGERLSLEGGGPEKEDGDLVVNFGGSGEIGEDGISCVIDGSSDGNDVVFESVELLKS